MRFAKCWPGSLPRLSLPNDTRNEYLQAEIWCLSLREGKFHLANRKRVAAGGNQWPLNWVVKRVTRSMAENDASKSLDRYGIKLLNKFCKNSLYNIFIDS